MDSNKELVGFLKQSGAIKSAGVEKAFLAVDRAAFVSFNAYEDCALPVLPSVTISQPSVVAEMLELLEVAKSQSVLDVGSGSGYTAALLSKLVGRKQKIVSIDVSENALTLAKRNCEKCGCKNIEFFKASGWFGFLGKRFDRILVSAACEEIPFKLVVQLKANGVMVLPLGGLVQELAVVRKTNGVDVQRTGIGVVFLRLAK